MPPLSLISLDAQLHGHERLCSDRWEELRREINDMRKDIKYIWKIIIGVGAAVIMGEAWLIVVLLIRGAI